MTHYDHATAMAFKLDKWGEARTLRNFELEALACAQRTSAIAAKKQSAYGRCLRAIGLIKLSKESHPKNL